VPQVTEERELIRAQARYVRSSARKARLVLEHIRGKPAVEAQSILAFQTRAVARACREGAEVGDRKRGEQQRPRGTSWSSSTPTPTRAPR
jgi:ribosomal protein L22